VGAFFEYEYEYRPPGRTEYEYEGGGQWAVGRFGLTRGCEAVRGNAQCRGDLCGDVADLFLTFWNRCFVVWTPGSCVIGMGWERSVHWWAVVQ
jgi:hypothetical protein